MRGVKNKLLKAKKAIDKIAFFCYHNGYIVHVHEKLYSRKMRGGYLAVTIKEIAKIAGVSVGTVDRAIHNRGGVNKAVADRINAIAAELNYSPNQLAKGLVSAKKQILIGAVINSHGNEFFDEVLSGIDEAAKRYQSYGLNLELRKLKGYDPIEQVQVIDYLVHKEVKGIIITPIDDPIVINRLNEVEQIGIPIVTINAPINGLNNLCFVGCDYYKSGRIAGELLGLVTKHCNSVAVVGGSKRMLGHRQRIQGFCDYIKEQRVVSGTIYVVHNDDDEMVSYIDTKALMLHEDIDGIYFCAGGVEGGIRAVKESGRSIKVITVDQTRAVTKGMKQGIITATITQQPYEQGETAVRVIFDYLFFNTNPTDKAIYTNSEIKIRSNLT